MLNAKQRATLIASAHNLPDIVFVGKEGLTDSVVEQIKVNLYAHELIKIKVQKGSEMRARDLAQDIAVETKSEIVKVVGNKIIVYKFSDKPKIKHYL